MNDEQRRILANRPVSTSTFLRIYSEELENCWNELEELEFSNPESLRVAASAMRRYVATLEEAADGIDAAVDLLATATIERIRARVLEQVGPQ